MVSRAKEEAATEKIAELSRQRDGAAAEASAAAAALAAARAAHVEAVQDARRKVGEAAEAERDALSAKLQTAEAQRDDARERSSASATELSIVRAQVLRPLTATLPLGVVLPPPLSWASFARAGGDCGEGGGAAAERPGHHQDGARREVRSRDQTSERLPAHDAFVTCRQGHALRCFSRVLVPFVSSS